MRDLPRDARRLLGSDLPDGVRRLRASFGLLPDVTFIFRLGVGVGIVIGVILQLGSKADDEEERGISAPQSLELGDRGALLQ